MPWSRPVPTEPSHSTWPPLGSVAGTPQGLRSEAQEPVPPPIHMSRVGHQLAVNQAPKTPKSQSSVKKRVTGLPSTDDPQYPGLQHPRLISTKGRPALPNHQAQQQQFRQLPMCLEAWPTRQLRTSSGSNSNSLPPCQLRPTVPPGFLHRQGARHLRAGLTQITWQLRRRRPRFPGQGSLQRRHPLRQARHCQELCLECQATPSVIHPT